MKKLFLFFILACITTGSFCQVLFTYGNNNVSKAEFLRAYNKNKTAVRDKEMALREYLDLYIKFKLKVKAAKDLGIDTLASVANDLQNFRTQIEENYLNDENRVNALIHEAFERSQKDIHVAYIFYPSKDFTDSVAVVKRHLLAKEAWTDLGFITAFNLPYDFENAVYALNPNKESKPVRSKTGYYIFKNIEERKAVGKLKAAQILIAIPEDAKEEDRVNAQKLIDSLYHILQSGKDFAELAKQYSNDKMTYLSGGIMPEFGVGKYESDFETKVFALQKDGDFTAPFHTQFGYHIVKRLSQTPITNDEKDAAFQYNLKQMVMQDNRVTSAKEKFVNDVLKKLNYKKNTAVKENDLWRMTDSLVTSEKIIPVQNLNKNTVLFSFNTENIKVSDWFVFVKNYKSSETYKGETYSEIMNKYVSTSAVDIYRKRLEDFNPEFKAQVQEFKDGNMLFEVMEKNVWNKASADSEGLKKYYDQNKTKYTWNESADAVLISASNEKVANESLEEIKKGKSWKEVAEQNISQLQTDSGRYELAQVPAKANTKFTEGMLTAPLVNENDGTATFVKIIRLHPANQQRSFEEARGLVINDYQVFLEEKWIEELKKKYLVTVNEKVFQSLL